MDDELVTSKAVARSVVTRQNNTIFHSHFRGVPGQPAVAAVSDGLRGWRPFRSGGGCPRGAGSWTACLLVWWLLGGFVPRGEAAPELPPGFALIQVVGSGLVELPVAMALTGL